LSRTIAERRSHARFPHKLDIRIPEDGRGTFARLVASDLSLGGLFCSSSKDYAEMTRLEVQLELPDPAGPETIAVEAVVVRRKELKSASGEGRFELGLFFTSMSDEARERLARFLAAHAS